MHSHDSCLKSSQACCRRVFLCVQYGPERRKANCGIHAQSQTMYKQTFARLRAAIGHALAEISVPVAIVQSEHDEFSAEFWPCRLPVVRKRRAPQRMTEHPGGDLPKPHDLRAGYDAVADDDAARIGSG